MRVRAAWLVVTIGACGTTASPELGLDSLMKIAGAQFRPGPFPAANGGQDAVMAAPAQRTAYIGGTFDRMNGILGTDARSAIIGLDGVDGAWIVPASFPGIENPNNATVTATMELSHDFPIGPFDVLVAGGDVDGKVGQPARGEVIAANALVPPGQLVVSLEWDDAADLDLHVVDPNGGEAWSGQPDTIPHVLGQDPFAYLLGGQLDHDGNASCRTGASPDEHVFWAILDQNKKPLPPPPSGTYTVRVDATAMCGAPDAQWYVAVTDENGAILATARGVATAADVSYGKHGAGAGFTALTFTR